MLHRARWYIALAAAALLSSGLAGLANYTATQGAGTNFGSIAIGGVHFISGLVCDATTANQCAAVSAGGALSVTVVNTNANGQAVAASSSPVTLASDKNISATPYPIGATAYTATATGTTGATTATLAGAASVTTYICGFSIRANATAAATGNATVTGVITATLNFTQWTAPNASGLGITEMIFNPCIPASGTNQSVAVVSAAPGTGGVVSVTAWGYKL